MNNRPIRGAGLLAVAALIIAGCGGQESSTPAPSAPAPSASAPVQPPGELPPVYEQLEWDMAGFVPAGTGQGQAYTRWMDELETRTGGAIRINRYFSAELVPAGEVKAATADGRVQLGNMSNAYTPSDFPLTRMVEIPYSGSSIGAQAVALNRLYRENAEFRQEWEGQGIKVLSFVPIPPQVMGTNEPVPGYDWFAGKTIRGSGYFVEALTIAGANPVSLAVNDTYEAMQRKTVEAFGGLILDFLGPTGLYEVADYFYDTGHGHFAITTWGMNLDTWNALSDDLRTLIEELNESFPDWVVETTSAAEDASCATVLEAGGQVAIFTEEQIAPWRTAIGDSALTNWLAGASNAGVANPQAMYDEYLSYYREEEVAGKFAGLPTGMERCVLAQG